MLLTTCGTARGREVGGWMGSSQSVGERGIHPKGLLQEVQDLQTVYITPPLFYIATHLPLCMVERNAQCKRMSWNCQTRYTLPLDSSNGGEESPQYLHSPSRPKLFLHAGLKLLATLEFEQSKAWEHDCSEHIKHDWKILWSFFSC